MNVIIAEKPISFIASVTAGAAGSVFVDHGKDFVVRDADGKNPMVKIVDKVCEVEILSDSLYVASEYCWLL